MESELILNRGGFPPLSARGCIQHLMPIEAGLLRRTINGALIYAEKPLAHKFRSIISCEDRASLALEGLWRGSEVRVGCISSCGVTLLNGKFFWSVIQEKGPCLQ